MLYRIDEMMGESESIINEVFLTTRNKSNIVLSNHLSVNIENAS